MKRKDPASDETEFQPTFLEALAAGVVAAVTGVLIMFIAGWWQGRRVDAHAVIITVLIGGLFGWLGGKSLRQLRVWTVAGKMFGTVLVAFGLLTATTGQRPEGPYKIRREVRRDADLPMIIAGLFLNGSAFLVEAWWRKRKVDAKRSTTPEPKEGRTAAKRTAGYRHRGRG